MKKTPFVLLLFAFLSFKNEREQRKFIDNDVKCFYETDQGRIDGNYVSFYTNGQKKSQGKFENNYRIGKWTVWDSTGRVRMQRKYSNPFTFKRIIPEVPNEKPVELLNVPRYTLQYNKDRYIDYFHLEERIVVWSKRIWRDVSPIENPILFENDKLINLLQRNILNKNITAYSVSDDEFKKELSSIEIDTSLKVIGFKTKEDCFFDNERLVSESRIIGICPVAINKKKQIVDLYWVYFPEIRKYLAQEKIQLQETTSKITTLDDLFFFRYFTGSIYKASNVYDRQISDYKTGEEIAKEAERIEIELIETEHDIWISFTK